MFCKYCGNKLPDGAGFCPACGAVVGGSTAESAFSRPERESFRAEPMPDPAREEEKSALATKILTFGIMSLAFSYTLILGIVGIIFSCICRSRIKDYVREFGPVRGRAAVGKGLSIGGLALGIFGVVFFTIYIIILVIAVAMAISAGGGSFDPSNDPFLTFIRTLNM